MADDDKKFRHPAGVAMRKGLDAHAIADPIKGRQRKRLVKRTMSVFILIWIGRPKEL